MDQQDIDKTAYRPGIFGRVFAIILVVISAGLIWIGGQLALIGGSVYYLIAGVLVLISGLLHWRGDRRGAMIYLLMLGGTWIWAFWEVGLDGWGLAPRLIGPSVLAIGFIPAGRVTAKLGSRLGTFNRRQLAAACAVLMAAASVGWLVSGQSAQSVESPSPSSLAAADDDWPAWGRDQGGTRYSALAQITPGNVGTLKLAWTFRTGFPQTDPYRTVEVTPLKIGASLYMCTPNNDIISLDSESGAVKWRFRARTEDARAGFAGCRGVAYFRSANALGTQCAERIYTGTIDARLIAVDALTGRPCPDFGKSGVVDLRTGLGEFDAGYYYITSAPQIVRGKLVLGGWVTDNQHVNEPSGVIRAFDAINGKLAWAFDVGRPYDHSEPGPGKTYTKGTPNSWAPISADESLGLVFLPTGNPNPDFFGGKRRDFDDRYGSSVVALDAETGALRWSFQTTHHDLWDYDVASQPTLYDLPLGGSRVRAVIVPTKRGEIFVLDRLTGRPLTPVSERPVPQTNVPGEWTSPTQPFSVGMPNLAGPELTEKTMWGITPLDQAWCRLEYRKSNYKGTMTPPVVGKPTIIWPGYAGGSNWGGITLDLERNLLIGNSMRVAYRVELIPRAEADALGVKPISSSSHRSIGLISAQAGTPYAVRNSTFMSPLDVPCTQPPFGMLTAIDMKTRKRLWEQPLGTAKDSGPLGLESQIPITMGVPNTGGSIATRSGLVFIGATQDRYLRAFSTTTGKLLWKARLPAGGQATPLTYLSQSGRQFVVIAAGGNMAVGSKVGDYLLAYALPK